MECRRLISHGPSLLSKVRAANDVLLADQTRLTMHVDPRDDEDEHRSRCSSTTGRL